MKPTFLICTLALVCLVSASAEQAGLKWNKFCVGKADGNYEHPSDCHKFVTCVYEGTQGYERDCASCINDPERCPNGRFVYNIDRNRCEYENEVECRVAKKDGSVVQKLNNTSEQVKEKQIVPQ